MVLSVSSNGFMVNGSKVEEGKNNGAAVGVNQGGTFGLVSGARNPRIMQVGAKFLF